MLEAKVTTSADKGTILWKGLGRQGYLLRKCYFQNMFWLEPNPKTNKPLIRRENKKEKRLHILVMRCNIK